MGYIYLKPKYKEVSKAVREENYKKNNYEYSQAQVMDQFVNKYEKDIEKVIKNQMSFDSLTELNNSSFRTLNTAFELLPLKTDNEDHKKFFQIIFPIFSKLVFKENDKTDYTLKHRFLDKFAYFILNRNREEIEEYIKPFVDNFPDSREMSDFSLSFRVCHSLASFFQ